MKTVATVFLQVVVVLIALGVLAFLIWEPNVEGRNVNATLFEVYFKDPFLAYAYLASISFFVAVFQTFRLLGYVRRDAACSQAAVKALRTIKLCALAMIGFVAVGEVFILLSESDDRAGGVVLGGVIASVSLVAAAVAALLEQIVKDQRNRQPQNG